MIIGVIACMFIMFLVIGPIMGMIDNQINVTIEGTYTIHIYVPDCDNGERVYTEYGVPGQFLYDNGYGEQEMFSDTLKPSGNFQKWYNYVRNKTGDRIQGDNLCINFIKE